MGGRRPCAAPGCPRLVDRVSHCPAHARQVEQQRGSRILRGYDQQWRTLRDSFMSRSTNQLCRACQSQGIITLATDVDHVVPFESISDPRRLDPSNLQPLCKRCHALKHAGG